MAKAGKANTTAASGPAQAALQFRSPASVLQARSIAIVGASERGAWPAQIIKNLKQHGFPGRVLLVNPKQAEVFGERCYPTLRDLPEAPEHVAIIVPSVAVPGVLDDADAAGAKSATIYAAGMGDGEDAKSRERGAWLQAFLQRSKMRISGPNCMGAMSYRERLFAYPNSGLAALPAGPVGIVFQSGGTLQFFMQSGADRGLRYSYAISSGNEPDLDLADYINFLVDDPHTHTIVTFIEGIRRPEVFMQAALKALAAGKPILAIKTGRSQGAADAAKSHTGAIAGDYAAYLAMCERTGLVACPSLDDLLETALAFQCRRWPKGPRIGFVTTSGGTVDLLHDITAREGAKLAEFSSATRAALQPVMQEGIKPHNPLDVGIPSTNAAAAEWCRIVLADDQVDMLGWAAQLPRKATGFGDVSPLTTMLGETDKPILGFSRMVYQVTPEVLAAQSAVGFPFLQGLETTVRAMNALWFYGQRAGSKPQPLPAIKTSKLTPARLHDALRDYGITLARSRFAETSAQAGKISAEVGFPAVVKIQSTDILHKTEAGGVIVDVRSPETVEMAAARLLAGVKARAPKARIDGFIVQEMVSGTEAIVGARSDPLYGPMLLVGAGGILVELANDTSLRLLPLAPAAVAGMVDDLKLAKLLAGYRGRPAADRSALEATAIALGQFYLDHRTVLADIEINPLMIRADGKGAVAVDVRAVWR